MKRLVVLIFIAFPLFAGHLVLNEVSMGSLQWVEIYNPTSSNISLEGWKIRNRSGEDVLHGTVSPHSYFLIVNYRDNFHVVFPNVTAPIFEPVDHSIGSGLNRSADMLQLVNPEGEVVDQINWGTPDPSWRYYTVSLWYPGILVNSELIARIPNGRDRDSATDWRVPSNPTPGSENPVMSGLDSSSWGKIKALFGSSGGRFL